MFKRNLLASALFLVSCGARSPLGENVSTRAEPGEAGAPTGPQNARVSNLALGQADSCAVMDDGTIRCWGYDDTMQFGRTPSTVCGGEGTVAAIKPCVKVPTVVPGLDNVARLALGATHTCALLQDGTVKCWGDVYGVRTFDAGVWTDPISIPISPPKVVELSADLHNACSRREDSTVYCWGDDADGQLGPASSDAFRGATQLSMGHNFTCARMADGTVQCAGLNDEGQLGNGMITGEQAHPIASVVVGLSAVVQISAGENHACAILQDRTVACWGAYFNRQFRTTSTPIPVPGLEDVVEVAAGDQEYDCARRRDGSVACWGVNLEGELGDGTFIEHASPATIPKLSAVIQIAVRGYHACALTQARAVYCWGLNVYGAVGDGTISDRNEPTRIDL